MKAEYETRVSDYYYRNDCDQKIRLGCGPHLHYHVELLYLSLIHISEPTTLALRAIARSCF